jgi:hypothetical protein
MKLLTELSNDYKQKHNIILENGESFDLTLEFIEQQEGWFYSIKYGDNFEVKGQRLVIGMNIIRKWKNLLPFGLGVMTEDLSEPSFVDDFTSGRVDVNILNESDVEEIEEEVYGQ